MENCSISHYFKSKQDCEDVTPDEGSTSSSDSPYKNILTNIQQVDLNSSNEANDFKTPKHFNNQKKIIQPKAKPSAKVKKSTKKKLHLPRQPKISSFTNCVETDTNREHMDMAVALSRSLQNECADSKFMLGLEQFAFKPGGSKLSISNRRPVLDRRKDRPKKYITPILMLRTREEREQIINTKISDLLLCGMPTVQTFYECVTLRSSTLQQYFKPNQSLFKISYLLCGDFYVEQLNLDKSLIKCGSLLKDWHEIPGRCVSPVNLPSADSIITNKTETCIKDLNKNVCTSPELFDSDDDNLYYIAARRSPAKDNSGEESSESLLTPKKSKLRKNSLISRSSKENILGTSEEDCFDLIQSSSSESNTSNKPEGHLKTGISEVFQNDLNVDENYFWDGENCRSKRVQRPRDTFDELFDNEINLSVFTKKNSPVSANSFNSVKSEESISISDDEINYSCNHGAGSAFEGFLSFSESHSDLGPSEENDGLNDTILYTVEKPLTVNECNTPKSEMIIKTTDVTPSANYNEMDTPKITRELEKFGIKPLKRKHGIKLLSYIYNSTHPVLSHTDVVSAREGLEENVAKKRKTVATCKRALIAETVSISEDFEDSEEPIFEKTQSKRIASCQIPLHIVWHNLVASDPCLQKSILLYEPLNLQLLYKTLKTHGYKFHIQDLLTFLDKKCITIRTEQYSRTRQKHSKRKSI